MRPIEQAGDLLGELQLVIPLASLAHERRLIAHLLSPADRHGAGAKATFLGDRRAARHEQHGNMFAGRIDGPNGAVCEADVGVHHDGLRAAGYEIIAVGHAHCRMLVWNSERDRQLHFVGRRFREAFDDRREIRTGVGEHVVDAKRLQARKNCAAGGNGFLTRGGHEGAPVCLVQRCHGDARSDKAL
jgi:hypothetical protein